jgi:hypothetical protein
LWHQAAEPEHQNQKGDRVQYFVEMRDHHRPFTDHWPQGKGDNGEHKQIATTEPYAPPIELRLSRCQGHFTHLPIGQ